SDIVVLVRRPRLGARSRSPLGRILRRTVRPIRLAPQRALPVARLSEKIVPCDRPVVWSGERVEKHRFTGRRSRLAWRLESQSIDRRHCLPDRVAHGWDEAAVERDADDGGEEALRHAVRHVDAVWFTPRGDGVTAPEDHTARLTARLERPDPLAEGLTTERLIVRHLH